MVVFTESHKILSMNLTIKFKQFLRKDALCFERKWRDTKTPSYYYGIGYRLLGSQLLLQPIAIGQYCFRLPRFWVWWKHNQRAYSIRIRRRIMYSHSSWQYSIKKAYHNNWLFLLFYGSSISRYNERLVYHKIIIFHNRNQFSNASIFYTDGGSLFRA